MSRRPMRMLHGGRILGRSWVTMQGLFDRLSLGIDREIGFLGECANQGLRIGGVIGSLKAAKTLLQIGVDGKLVTYLTGYMDGYHGGHITNEHRAQIKMTPALRASVTFDASAFCKFLTKDSPLAP